MIRIGLSAAVGVVLLWGVPLARAAEAAADGAVAGGSAVVETVEGAATLVAYRPGGRSRHVGPGDVLEPGEVLDTPQGVAANLAFEPGTQVLVGGATSIAVQPPVNAGMSDEAAAIEVRKGEVRTVVQPGQAKTFKFYIHTPVAVLGVRGTDFIVSSAADSASVHTMEGQVEVAHDRGALHAGQVTRIPAGQFSEARHSGGAAQIGAPRGFEVAGYLREFHQRHPRLEALHQRALKYLKMGGLRARLRQIRKVRLDRVQDAPTDKNEKEHPKRRRLRRR